jgi:ubiquinone/menaquinone biosynthesis C-methylase UbiE
MTTGTAGQVEVEHLHRYFLARNLVRGMEVLDIAAGEGYGSALLAQTAKSVTGVEIDPQAVAHAAANYQSPSLRFLQGSAQAIPIDSQSVDAVVSFETVEHFYDQEKFLSEVRRVLRPEGLLIISSPNRDVYSAPGSPPNPHHIRELTLDEFKDLLSQQFRHVKILGQRPIVGSVVVREGGGGEDSDLSTFDRRAEDTFECSSGFDRALYYIALASNVEIPRLPESFYFDLTRIDDILHVPALQSALAGRNQEVAQLADELLQIKTAVANLASERDSALSALAAAQFAKLSDDRRGMELATEVRKVLRQPWRPLAQRSLYYLFSALAAPLPGRLGGFFERQAKQRSPRRLEALVRDADSEKERLHATPLPASPV